MRTLRNIFLAVLFLCVGLPLLFVLFVLGMAAFGVVFGIGMSIVGLLLAVVKIALMVIIPVAVIVWLFRRLSEPSRVS